MATSSAIWKSPTRGKRSGSRRNVTGGRRSRSVTTTKASSAHTEKATDAGAFTMVVVDVAARRASARAVISLTTLGWATIVTSVVAGRLASRSP